MEKELLKCLVDFYSKLEKLDIKWKELSRILERNVEALQNQTEQLRHVTSPEVDNAEICKIEGLRERLIFKIHAGIENEVTSIYGSLTHLNNNSQDLKNRLTKIEAARSKLSIKEENMKELVHGTSYRPRLNLLLEWAIDACDHYHDLKLSAVGAPAARRRYREISAALSSLDYKERSSVERLASALREDELARMKIDRILAYTQFLAKENYK